MRNAARGSTYVRDDDRPHSYGGSRPSYYFDSTPGYYDSTPGYYDGPPIYYDGPRNYDGPRSYYGGPPIHYDGPRNYDGPRSYYGGPPDNQARRYEGSHRRRPARRLAARTGIQVIVIMAVLAGTTAISGVWGDHGDDVDRTIAIADAYTDTAEPLSRHGSETQVTVSSDGAARVGYIKFDVGRLPETAKPRLTITVAGDAGTLQVHSTAIDWNEHTIEPGNAPPTDGLLAAVDVKAGDRELVIDVPQSISSDGVYSLAIVRTTRSGSTRILSSESGPTTAPRLIIEPPPRTEPEPTEAPSVPPDASSTRSPSSPPPPSPTAEPSGDYPSGDGPERAGSATVGTAAYPVPSGGIFVSPSGSDSAAGSQSTPLRSLSRAVAAAAPGATIVLREGSYHESVTVPAGKRLTIQSYPNEEVWLEGSSAVTSWTRSGAVWRHDGWTAQFDASPTYTPGAPPSSDPSWRFFDSSHPMAAHPDQVWIDGSALKQVGSLDQVGAGEFYVDYGADRLYVGSDPAGRSVRASSLVDAITVRSAGSVLRGFGVRRYAPSIPTMAAVKAIGTGMVVENLVIADMATTGLSAMAGDVTFRDVTVVRSGMLGIHASLADSLLLDSVLSQDNNTEHFKQAPVSGGVKIHKSRHIAVVNSVFQGNLGPGIWTDESVYDITVAGNDLLQNAGHGISLELSAKAIVANNLFVGNGGDGMKINDTPDVQIWNNTLTGNGRSINLVQDFRRASDTSAPGHDPRQPLPDPTVTWIMRRITVSNNVIADTRASANCLLCVEDYSHQRSAEQMEITANGNVYVRPDGGSPTWLVVWSRGAGNPAVFTTLGAFQSATGQEGSGLSYIGASFADGDGYLAGSVVSDAGNAARALPSAVAAVVGQPTGARHMGAWRG